MSKLTFKSEAQEGLLNGINKLADAVGATLGAHGKTVLFRLGGDPNGIPQSTKDGVTVAANVVLDDPIEDMGCSIVKDAARKTARTAGDGTTTSTVLARAILCEAVGREGSQRDYIRGVENASKQVLSYLDDISVKVTDDMLDYVANISTNNDSDLGGIISQAFKDVGEFGHVWYQANPAGVETYAKIESGAQIERGFLDPAFINNQNLRTVDLENPLIFMSTTKIDNLRQLEPILEVAVQQNRALLVIAEAETQVSTVLLANKLQHNRKFNIINPPHHGVFMREAMEDLADLVGATLHGTHMGDAAENITAELLGECDFAQSDLNNTILQITEKVDLTERIANIQHQIEMEPNPDRVKTLRKRLATIAGGVGMVYVGAPSDGELKEKLDRVDDAIHAVKAALLEGILPGGGVALKNASETIKPKGDGDSYSEGYNALLEAIKTPFELILSNAGLKVPGGLKIGWGVNVLTSKKVDMKAEGIIDPTMATREALINAVSVSKTILSTGLTIL